MTSGAPVWMYWEQGLDRAPPWIRWCVRTAERHASGSVTVLDRAAADQFVQTEPPPRWPELSPAWRSDLLRMRLLHEFGGIWLDADTIVLRDPAVLLDSLAGAELLVADRGNGTAESAVLAAAARTDLLAELRRRQEVAVQQVDPRARYTAIGPDVVAWAMTQQGARRIPASRVMPVHWRDARRFLSTVDPGRDLIGPEQITVSLFNAVFGDTMARLTDHDLRSSPLLLARLLRYALGDAPSVRPRGVRAVGAAGWTMWRSPAAGPARRLHASVRYRLRRAVDARQRGSERDQQAGPS